jgi:hypothetical protein
MRRPRPAPSTRRPEDRCQRSDDRRRQRPASRAGARLLVSALRLSSTHAPSFTTRSARPERTPERSGLAPASLGPSPRTGCLSSVIWTFASTWWSQRGGPTRPHSELGRETPPRPGYCPPKGGRAGHRQVEPAAQAQRACPRASTRGSDACPRGSTRGPDACPPGSTRGPDDR